MSFISDILGAIGLGSSNTGGSSKTYVPTGLGNADQAWKTLLQGQSGRIGGQNALTDPVLVQGLAQMLGIDPSQFLNAAQQAGNLSQGQINPALNAQNSLFGQAGNISRAGNQIYETSFDPQNALRDRLQQQVTDASRASTSARGIGMGGEAAGIENQDVSRFLQDWQNQQLQRQYMGLQGLSGAYNQAGRDYAGGLAAGGLAPGYAQQSGAIPYGAQQQAAMNPFQAVGAYNQGVQPGNLNTGNLMSMIIPYLNQGLGATGQAFNQTQTGLGNLAGIGTYNYGTSQNPQSIFSSLGSIFGLGGAGAGAGAAASASPALDASLFFMP